MKKLMMTLCAIAILALPGCCCKRSNAPKAKTHSKKAAHKKHVVKKHKAAHKKHVVKKHKATPTKKHKKHVHIELDNTDALFA